MEPKTVGEVWAIYERAGLTKPHISQHSFFKDAEILKELLNRITELEAEMKQILNEFDKVEAQRDEVLEILKNLCDYIAPLGSIAGEPFKIAQHILNK